jgi:hypothetical protein
MDPHEDPVWIINTSTAAELLPQMLHRFHLGYQDPLIFGTATTPEAVVIPYKLWQTLTSVAEPVDNSDLHQP